MLYAADLTSFMPQVESQSTGKSALEKMVWIPGGKLFHGIGQALSGRSAGAFCFCRWILDGSIHGH